MRWVVRPRQRGKTTEAIRWAQQEERGGPARYIVVDTYQDAHRLFDQSRDEDGNPTIRLPIPFREAVGYGGHPAVFAIDDVDRILRGLVRGPVELVTRTGEPDYTDARLFFSPDGDAVDLYCDRCHRFLRGWPLRALPVAAAMDAFDAHHCDGGDR